MRDAFTSTRTVSELPRIPLKGSIDLTYRCNNRCRHCWVWTDKGEGELTKEEIFDIVDQARAMGCREWAISGGEPMLRPDFPEIFDYITSRCRTYSLNTNGTLITPEIAELMKRKGSKMVALYGATAEVHDHITRNSGSFDATMRGFELLKEAGAGFTVQIVPMKDNYHQLDEMKALAASLSPHWRFGASWLFLSADLDPIRNAEIINQRLQPREVVALDMPNLYSLEEEGSATHSNCLIEDNDLFAACIRIRRDFHVDPFGTLSFCDFIKDPSLRYDLRRGTFRGGWENFIPSLAETVHGGDEYMSNCGSCQKRDVCLWCPVYSYLEKGRYCAPVAYLCKVADENLRCRATLMQDHRRYYRIGGITIQVDSDLPFTGTTFAPKFDDFRVDGPGDDIVSIHHHFGLPKFRKSHLDVEVYRRPPWAIYKHGRSWIYTGIPPDGGDGPIQLIAVFSEDHTSASIYNEKKWAFEKGNLGSLTMFPTDQILIARLLADRTGFYLHSAGAVLDGRGLVFAGHSEAGKTTISRMLESHGQILCDDRTIVRWHEDGWRVYGTWSHGDLSTVSPCSAPLESVFFIEKSDTNRITLIEDRSEILRKVLAIVIQPMVDVNWWENTLDNVEKMVKEVPFYRLEFEKSGDIVSELKHL